jgi:uncharacterized low-complexity protein
MADDKHTKSIDDVLAHVSDMRRGMLKALLVGAAGITAVPLMTSKTLAGDVRSYSKTELERLGENEKDKKGKNAKGKAGNEKTGKGKAGNGKTGKGGIKDESTRGKKGSGKGEAT